MRALPEARAATRADLEDLPETLVGEIIEGVLYTTPRPRAAHALVGGALHADLLNPFQRGRGGPGGWWILIEPGVELPGAAEIVPDVAGWRRDRLPRLPTNAAIRVVPDWVCEILSPTTRRHDQRIKKPFYARAGVDHLWIVDVDVRTLSTHRRVGDQWLETGVYSDADAVRAEPFADVEVSMADWWLPEGASEA